MQEYYIIIVIIGLIVLYGIYASISSAIKNKIDKKYHISEMHSEINKLTREKQTVQDDFSRVKKRLSTLEDIRIEHEILTEKSKDKDELISKLQQDKIDQMVTISSLEKELDSKLDLRGVFSSNLTSLPYFAGMMADYLTYDIEAKAKCLDWGFDIKRLKKVDDIRDIRKVAKAKIEESRIAYYQLEYLKQLYPGIEDLLEVDISEVNISIGIPEHDTVRDYITKEEYNALSESARNQLALDRYVESHAKSKWQIGRDYELYVGYIYQRNGFAVDYYGSYKKLEDLGRDLIAKKGNTILIVQCKYWSERKEIHEKHITQLYGTAICYCCENNIEIGNVVPVLVTNISLSDMAKKMANYLNVKYKENLPMGNFPRIKCNIGKGEFGKSTKIYHLPMDLQYDAVKIDKKGEFFAFTVQEAEQAGFKRAHKWHQKNE